MPELPEVETVVRGLRQAGLAGAVIREVAVLWPRSITGATPGEFAAALCGRAITAVDRRAKYIVLALDDGRSLLVHLRMTGQFRLGEAAAAADAHDRVVLRLADGRALHFHDTRKFGRFRIVAHPGEALAKLGPEPLDAAFTPELLRARLRGRRRLLKPLLLDQEVIAGLGNIYVDEALWAARLHPQRRADTLRAADFVRLHAAIREVLTRAVAAGGTTLGTGATNFLSVAGRRGGHAEALRVFRRHGAPCPRCGAKLARMVVAARGTHLCPRCQRR